MKDGSNTLLIGRKILVSTLSCSRFFEVKQGSRREERRTT